jgi:hypothetical protein
MFHEPDRNDAHDVMPATEQAALEALLRRLQPSPPQLDRDQLMFAAGQASVDPRYIGRPPRSAFLTRRFWPAATALMTAASVVLAFLLVEERRATHDNNVVQSTHPAPQPITVTTAIAAADPPPLPIDANAVLFPWLVWPGLGEPASGYLATRNAALSQGLAAIDRMMPISDRTDYQPPDRQKPATAQELLQEYLPNSATSSDTSS